MPKLSWWMFQGLNLFKSEEVFMRKVFFFMILLGIIMSLSSQTAVMPEGKGTKESPYLIATWQNLYWLSRRTDADIHYTKKMSSVYKQVNDIIFPENTKKWSYIYALEPIGYYYTDAQGYDFSGEYDGQNHSISGVYINCPDEDYIGLFGIIRNGKIKNIRLFNAKIIGDSNVGGIAGLLSKDSALNDFIISNCYVEGYIQGKDDVGALFGSVDGYDIKDCRSKARIDGDNSVGGLVGLLRSNMINCSSLSNITGGYRVGGLIGSGDGSIINCSSNSEIYGKSEIGGLSGEFSGLIRDSYSQGNVTGGENVAGLTASDRGSLLIENSYSLANVNAQNNAGGIYAINTHIILRNSHYKANTVTCPNVINKLGELSESDFDQWISSLSIKSNFTLLKNEKGEYMIRTIDDLKMLDFVILSKANSFILMNDLDLKNEKNLMIAKFEGSFNGNNKTIKNLTIDLPNESIIGFFRDVQNAKIFDLNFDQANIKGKDNLGALAGMVGSGSEITNCTITGNISGNEYVALIAGKCNGDASNCKTYGSVKGNVYIAGMMARIENHEDFDQKHTFSNMINYASVDAEVIGSGIFCDAIGTINNCFNYGPVSAKQRASGLFDDFGGYSVNNSGNYGNVISDNASAGIANLLGGTMKHCFNYGEISSKNIACGIIICGWSYQIINTFNEGSINANNIYAPITADLREFDQLFNPDRLGGDQEQLIKILENTYYNYEKIKVNGKKLISLGAINDEQYNKWKKNKLKLNIDDYLKKNKKGAYIIESFEDLDHMLPFVYEDYSFILQNDIDLKKHENFHIPYFQNTFDGNNKSISNLNLNDPNMFFQGLLSYVRNAEIRNLTIKDANVSAQECSGLLSGYIIDSSIQNIKCQGVVKSKSASGGISAYIDRTSILNCSANVSSSGLTFVGGMFGLSIDSEISSASFKGSVYGSPQISKDDDYFFDRATGGLVGFVYTTRIKNSYTISNISGVNQGSICGAFIFSSLINTYSIINNENKDFSGLFAISNDFEERYGWGDFSIKTNMTEDEFGTLKNNYINCPDKMKPQIKNGIYKTKAQLKNKTLYKETNWDFRIWNIDPKENEGYPYLK